LRPVGGKSFLKNKLVSQENDVICHRIVHIEFLLVDISGIHEMMPCDARNNPGGDPEGIKLAPRLIQAIPHLSVQVGIKLCFRVYPEMYFLADEMGGNMSFWACIEILIYALEPHPVAELKSFDVIAVRKIEIIPVDNAVGIIQPAFENEPVKGAGLKPVEDLVFGPDVGINCSEFRYVLIEPQFFGKNDIKFFSNFFLDAEFCPQAGIIDLPDPGKEKGKNENRKEYEPVKEFIFQGNRSG
jgi:hypothetical protein